jgi:hypothetical protein
MRHIRSWGPFLLRVNQKSTASLRVPPNVITGDGIQGGRLNPRLHADHLVVLRGRYNMRANRRSFVRSLFYCLFLVLAAVPLLAQQSPSRPNTAAARNSQASSQAGLQEPDQNQNQLTALPKIGDLELAARSAKLTVVSCEADARAYSDSPTAELISSITDARLHELNTEAFACMMLGGTGVRYGYLLKTVVDAAYAVHSVMTTQENLQAEKHAFAQVADKEVHRLLDQYNDVVGKYNDLVARYNSLLSSSQAVERYAEQLRWNNNQLLVVAATALGEASVARYSQPQTVTMPSAMYVRQSPLSCTTQNMPAAVPGLSSWSYTNCH